MNLQNKQPKKPSTLTSKPLFSWQQTTPPNKEIQVDQEPLEVDQEPLEVDQEPLEVDQEPLG